MCVCAFFYFCHSYSNIDVYHIKKASEKKRKKIPARHKYKTAKKVTLYSLSFVDWLCIMSYDEDEHQDEDRELTEEKKEREIERSREKYIARMHLK